MLSDEPTVQVNVHFTTRGILIDPGAKAWGPAYSHETGKVFLPQPVSVQAFESAINFGLEQGYAADASITDQWTGDDGVRLAQVAMGYSSRRECLENSVIAGISRSQGQIEVFFGFEGGTDIANQYPEPIRRNFNEHDPWADEILATAHKILMRLKIDE